MKVVGGSVLIEAHSSMSGYEVKRTNSPTMIFFIRDQKLTVYSRM